MKQKIHPVYYDDAKVSCSCGNTFVTGSTVQDIKIEVCANCHPFYTNKMRYVDTLGRVEHFQKLQKHAQAYKSTVMKKQQEKKKKKQQEDTTPKTLREMLLGR